MIGGLGLPAGQHRHARRVSRRRTVGAEVQGAQPGEPDRSDRRGLLLEHLGEQDAADRLERAIAEVIRKGEKSPTTKEDRNDPTAVGTSQFADAVIEEMGA